MNTETWVPRQDAPYEDLIRFGGELIFGLDRLPRTAVLISPIARTMEGVKSARAAVLEADGRVGKARSDVREAERDALTELRALRSDTHTADGGAPGPVTALVLPDGVPWRSKSWERLRQLEQARVRLTRVGTEFTDLAEEWTQRLTACAVELRRALQARIAAIEALDMARDAERTARREYVVEIDRAAGHLRALFPKDPLRIRAIWPARRHGRRPDRMLEPEVIHDLHEPPVAEPVPGADEMAGRVTA